MSAYAKDREWSDQFIDEIKRIVGPRLLIAAPLDVDRREAADLIVLRGRDMTIAARVRRAGYADAYPFDFTIRSARQSGAKTEMAKMVEGLGDWMFYGHASSQPGKLVRWWLIDLHVWRASLIRQGWDNLAVQKDNFDGTRFMVFDVRKFERRLILACSHPLDNEVAA